MALHCFSNASALDASVTNLDSIIIGFKDFIERHTEKYASNNDGLFCVNNENIILNNLHKQQTLVATSGYMPEGMAATEAQAVAILGYLHLHEAFSKRGVSSDFLDMAEMYMDAYLDHFYRDTPIPNSPQMWRCHWVINGKEPFRTLGPVNFKKPQASGAWDVPVVFNNGVGFVPKGSPYYGEQLAYVYNVYEGLMTWENVLGDPDGVIHDVDFFVDDRGVKMKTDGTGLADPPQTEFPIGQIHLTDKTFTGTLNVSFSCHSGMLIDRNMPFESWPMWQHVEKGYYGNAADAEEWMCEAFWMMFNATGKNKYLKAFNACSYTLWEMANLPSQNVMFIRDTGHISTTPFTEGISYWWKSTINADATCVRNPSDGYIRIEKTEELFVEDKSIIALEQMALINKVNNQSYISLEMGISASLSAQRANITNIFCRISDQIKFKTGRIWRHPVLSNESETPVFRQYKIRNMVAYENEAGVDYAVLNGSSFVSYNNGEAGSTIEYGILGDSRRFDVCGTVYSPDNSSGVVIGFWSGDTIERQLAGLTYKYTSNNPLSMFVKDLDGWEWEYVLPGAGLNNWVTVNIGWADLKPNLKQEKSGLRPSSPNQNDKLTEFQISLPSEGDPKAGSAMTIYCYGDIPSFFDSDDYKFMNWFQLKIRDHNEFVCNIGDVSVENSVEVKETYTPGVIPFSTNYSPERGKAEFYRGTPYTGYVYPMAFLIQGRMDAVNNCIDFLYAAQEDYYRVKGIMGPSAPIYIWPRWENLRYGEAETFVYLGAKNDVPWPGYYSRTVFASARLWEQMVKNNLPVPDKLVAICERWTNYLADFMEHHDDNTPSIFPYEGIPYNLGYDDDPAVSKPDHVGDMTAHFMASAILCKNAGSTNPNLDKIIDGCVREFERTYVVEFAEETKHMSGSYSAWVGGGYFYGFWLGEIMRSFGILLEYRDTQLREPPSVVEDDLWRIGLEDGSTLMTEDGQEMLYNNPVYFESMVLPLITESGDQIMLEDGVGYLCEELN